ncbi:sensor domain-containing protein [Clostridium thermosuccinogenes]|uniref:sensor domain-containing protein n=1 Tax=Clostridium thermosuccinogenes TaxID=84032 RepID=UPI000CCC9156|nr:bifunctional diguanylate cyclase/phosphodiesterase [Pseudoclostridium thermosuccinogenes]PNT92596.1 hypothetical protein CDQ83_03250 [Pseudoclostridium thermosuccinogenes]
MVTKTYKSHKNRHENLLDLFPCALYVIRDTVVIDCNNAAVKIFGYESKKEIIGRRLYELSPEKQPDGSSSIDKGEKIFKNALGSEDKISFRWMHKRKDGNDFPADIRIVNENGTLYAVMTDINETEQLKGQLTEKDYLNKDLMPVFKKILENTSEGVVITDTDGHIQWINTAFNKITGYSLPEVKGRKMNILKSGIQDQHFYNEMWEQVKNKGTWSGEIWNKAENGELYSEWLTISSIKDEENKTTHYVGIFKDLSEKKKIDRRMAELQQKDLLTGLYNRGHFLQLVDKHIKTRKDDERFSVIFIDIEGFREINSSLGHHIGDKLLIEISKRLLLVIKDNSILSRYSGDEFVILSKSIGEETDVVNLAEKLLESIRQPFMIENTVLNIETNIGISRFPDDGRDAETLIRYAETALYKKNGRSEKRIFFYSEDISREIEERFRMANLLTMAISNSEMSVYYQPIFDVGNPKNIVGAEALLRWDNPVFGRVSPDVFIPLAEKTGHIKYIGEWVLEQVCKQINLWKQKGYGIFPIAVNISVEQLEHAEFCKRVMEIIEKNNVKPDNIELEITERVSSGDLATIVKNLKGLKKYGIKFSMDDFGTGFSSLGQIDLFELDKLKIDKIFIDGLLNVSKKQNLVKSIIAMAKSLNLTVVAEGIETNEQLLYLKEAGCQLGQGYLVSRPLPPEEIDSLLHT